MIDHWPTTLSELSQASILAVLIKVEEVDDGKTQKIHGLLEDLYSWVKVIKLQ